MNSKKVFIFDFDGTLYSGDEAFAKIPNFIKRNKRKFFPNLTDYQYRKIAKENPEWKDVWVGCDIVNFIYKVKEKYPQYNISVKDFWSWQNTTPDPIIIDENEVVEATFLRDLCKQYPVYVVSNSSPLHIKFYMDKIGIRYSWFKKVISNHFISTDKTKGHYYQDILEEENCLPSQVYVFGDSIKNDLNPAKKMGMNTKHINSAVDIPKLVSKVLENK